MAQPAGSDPEVAVTPAGEEARQQPAAAAASSTAPSQQPAAAAASSTAPSAGAHGPLPAFGADRPMPPGRLEVAVDRGVDAWLAWKQRWDDYAMLTNLPAASRDIQMARLRSCLGDDTLRVVRNLDIPDRELTVKRVLEKLREYFLGQVNEVVERRNFNVRCQLEGECFEDFFVALRELSATCNFCELCRDSLTRDRIVVGLRDQAVIKKLCAIPRLTLGTAVEMCRAEEAADRDVTAIVGRAEPPIAAARHIRVTQGDNGRDWAADARHVRATRGDNDSVSAEIRDGECSADARRVTGAAQRQRRRGPGSVPLQLPPPRPRPQRLVRVQSAADVDWCIGHPGCARPLDASVPAAEKWVTFVQYVTAGLTAKAGSLRQTISTTLSRQPLSLQLIGTAPRKCS